MPTISSVAAISRFSRAIDGVRQSLEIVILDVSAILTEVDGDSGGSASLCCQGSLHRIRLVDPPGLPDGGDVVDVDAESGHLTHPWMCRKGDARGDSPYADEQGQEYTPSDQPDRFESTHERLRAQVRTTP